MKYALTFLLFFGGLFQRADAQDTTTIKTKVYRNSIRFNVTNPVIFSSRSLIFGYERVLSNHTTFSINLGQASFPSLGFINSDSLKANSDVAEKGFNISADYRFYLKKENKYAAPRGIYIGPYFSHNYFQKKNSWELKSSSGGGPQTIESTTSLVATGVGFEMGYQFILWDRMVIDMILAGPGVAGYKLKSTIGANLSEEDKQKFFERLNQALLDKFPGYSRVIDEGEFERQGSANTTKLGYRYMIMIGFRF